MFSTHDGSYIKSANSTLYLLSHYRLVRVNGRTIYLLETRDACQASSVFEMLAWRSYKQRLHVFHSFELPSPFRMLHFNLSSLALHLSSLLHTPLLVSKTSFILGTSLDRFHFASRCSPLIEPLFMKSVFFSFSLPDVALLVMRAFFRVCNISEQTKMPNTAP